MIVSPTQGYWFALQTNQLFITLSGPLMIIDCDLPKCVRHTLRRWRPSDWGRRRMLWRGMWVGLFILALGRPLPGLFTSTISLVWAWLEGLVDPWKLLLPLLLHGSEGRAAQPSVAWLGRFFVFLLARSGLLTTRIMVSKGMVSKSKYWIFEKN